MNKFKHKLLRILSMRDARPWFKRMIKFMARKGDIRNIYVIDFVVTIIAINWWVVAIVMSNNIEIKALVSIVTVQVAVLLMFITIIAGRQG